MKTKILTLLLSLFSILSLEGKQWIRINQVGYLPNNIKVAVLISESGYEFTQFNVIDAFTFKSVYRSKKITRYGRIGKLKCSYRLDFSGFNQNGTYFLRVGKCLSPIFRINQDVYSSSCCSSLEYFRNQRCGYNPLLRDSCHTHGGIVVNNSGKTLKHIDISGGWHNASDYIQHTSIISNSILQLMLAYQNNPKAFADRYSLNGTEKKNKIPDIIDEIHWGLSFLCKLNPHKNEMYHQIGDDRGYVCECLPNKDSLNYGYGKGNGRPLYLCTGKPQRKGNSLNNTTGVANIAAKFASCFSLGSKIMKGYSPEFSDSLKMKAIDAYNFAQSKPGVCQSVSMRNSSTFEEENWVDDMELASILLYQQEKDKKYLDEAIDYGRKEKISPWTMQPLTKHYQFYPYINFGHYLIAEESSPKIRAEFISYIETGLNNLQDTSNKNAFLFGIPSIWRSNKLVLAVLIECKLYKKLTNNNKFDQLEAALRDWLLGCNPWGISMAIKIPCFGNYPYHPHSILSTKANFLPEGGVISGPIHHKIFNKIKNIEVDSINNNDVFQSSKLVYHDCSADFATNEPIIDATASLCYYLSSFDNSSKEGQKTVINRTNLNRKEISLLFIGDSLNNGVNSVLNTLHQHNIKASFLFTNHFLRKKQRLINNIHKEGHYISLLYQVNPEGIKVNNKKTALRSKKIHTNKLLKSYRLLSSCGIKYKDAQYFTPAYSNNNKETYNITKQLGLSILSFTPYSLTNTDNTSPEMEYYYSNERIYHHLLSLEKENKHGLNGYILLFHLSKNRKREEAFYNHYLEKTINKLTSLGYQFKRVDKAIKYNH